MPDAEEIEAEEPVESLLLQWYEDAAALRNVAYSVHRLTTELFPQSVQHLGDRIPQAVERFLAIAAAARQEDFEGLFVTTAQLQNRGVEVLHPERGPVPVASPFVRRMPDDQAEIEAKRYMRLGRHMDAYESHIIASMEHFKEAWIALLDGALSCDPEMTADEFPKLAVLATEVRKAYEIWVVS